MNKKYAIFLGILGLVLFFHRQGWAAKWEFLNRYDYGDGWSTMQYYDSKSIVRTNEVSIRVWIRQNNEKTAKDPSEDLPSYQKLIEMNCSSGEIEYLRILTHLKDGDYEEDRQGELDYLVPDTSIKTIQEVLCQKEMK